MCSLQGFSIHQESKGPHFNVTKYKIVTSAQRIAIQSKYPWGFIQVPLLVRYWLKIQHSTMGIPCDSSSPILLLCFLPITV